MVVSIPISDPIEVAIVKSCRHRQYKRNTQSKTKMRLDIAEYAAWFLSRGQNWRQSVFVLLARYSADEHF